MKIIRLKDNSLASTIECSTSIAVGNFDGVHKGHQKLLDTLKSTAKELNTATAVWSFCDFTPKNKGKCITLPDERISILARLGIDYLILYEFESVKDLPCEEFLSKILINTCRAEAVCCGFNFRFGKNAEGDFNSLSQILSRYGKKAFMVDAYEMNGITVSSSLIRQCIKNGDMEKANEYLGRHFSVCLPVVHGRKLGRTIDSPTINQNFPPEHIVPRYGVYACRVIIDGDYYGGVSNVGVRPSVNGQSVNCETHIFDYSGDLYDREIRVEFCKFIRDEQAFASVEELKNAISRDKETARRILEAFDTPHQ